MLCGLMLNALVTDANSGAMPVVGVPSSPHPIGPSVAGGDTENTVSFCGGSSATGTVQRRRFSDAFRSPPGRCDLPTSRPQVEAA